MGRQAVGPPPLPLLPMKLGFCNSRFAADAIGHARPKFVAHRGDCGPRLARAVVTRIPGRSVGDPMNSMPAVSRAPLTSSNVDERLGGTSSTASKRLIVLAVTPAFLANCSVVQRRAFLAERI